MKQVFTILFVLRFFSLWSQELNCQIEINYTQIQGSANKQIFDQMQKSIFEFMNSTRWTNETYLPQERIECSILIIISKVLATDEYQASIQVSSRRPVYKSGYYTPVLNVEDENFQFKFQQFSQLEFNINTFQNNLTAVLAYYAYVILASDSDSFASMGGTGYWQKAQQIVNNAQMASERGWQSNEAGQKNRYWLCENALQPVFKGLRECLFNYCYSGLDHMHQDVEASRTSITSALEQLQGVYAARPASYAMLVFFNAKRDEIVNLYKGAGTEEKSKILELLMRIDPTGATKYLKIQG